MRITLLQRHYPPHQQWAAAMWRIPLLLASAAATLAGWAAWWFERDGAGG